MKVLWGPILALAWQGAVPLPAAAERVSLELVMAIDVSLSVNDIEFGLQMDGIAAAFRDGEIARLIEGHKHGAAVLVTLWSGTREAKIPLPWLVLRNGNDAARYADLIEEISRPGVSNFTALGHALSFAMEQLSNNGYAGDERTIDVSGDGRNNTGPEPWTFKPQADAHGITINGLAIVNNEDGLTSYYQRNVISGANSFVISAQDFSDFRQAFRRKLVRELGAKIVLRGAPLYVAWSRP